MRAIQRKNGRERWDEKKSNKMFAGRSIGEEKER